MNLNLVKLLVETPLDEVTDFFPEEFSAALTFCETLSTAEEHEALRARSQEWAQRIAPPERATEGSRQQPLLRQIIDDLIEGRGEELAWDEARFLMNAFLLMDAAGNREQFSRPLSLLQPHVALLEERLAGTDPEDGISHLRKRVAIVTVADLVKAPLVEIRKFAGIEVYFRGPVFRHRGFLKIVGSVPDSCAVVVEDGSCFVNGFVQGKIAVTGNCEVKDTISGMVVSSQRAVRARGLVTPAIVVAKTGRVGCYMTQAPKLVYAGSQIRIADSAMLGSYFSPRIRVANQVDGGEWNVSAAMRGGRFLHSETRQLSVIFRKSLSCLDYGEAIPPNARVLLAARGRLLTHCEYLSQAYELYASEMNTAAENALTYLMCGEQVRDLLQQVERLRGRVAVLDRIIAGATLLKRFAAERARPAGGVAGGEGDAEFDNSLRDLEGELRPMLRDVEMPKEIQQMWDALLAQFNAIGAQAAAFKISRVMDNVHRNLQVWSSQRVAMATELDSLQQKLAGTTGSLAVIERARETKNPMGALHQVLKAALSKQDESPLCQRARNPVLAHMVRLIQQKQARVKYFEQELGRERQRTREIVTQLETEQNLSFPAQEDLIQVSGRFEGGGTICYNGMRQNSDPDLFENACTFMTSGGRVVTYECAKDGEISLLEGEGTLSAGD